MKIIFLSSNFTLSYSLPQTFKNSMHKTQVHTDAHHLVLHTDVAAWLRKQEISGDKSSSWIYETVNSFQGEIGWQISKTTGNHL